MALSVAPSLRPRQVNQAKFPLESSRRLVAKVDLEDGVGAGGGVVGLGSVGGAVAVTGVDEG